MVRLVAALLCGVLLAVPSGEAEQPKVAAVTVDIRADADVERLLKELAKQEDKLTVFLDGEVLAPEQNRQIVDAGHEIGLIVHTCRDGKLLSRRQMAAQIMTGRKGLPEGYKVKWLRLGESCTDGAWQVARAKNLAILGSPEPGTQVRDGTVVALGDATVDEVLLTVTRLRKQGFRLVTVTELARLRGMKVQPGRSYRSFSWETLRKNDRQHFTVLTDCALLPMDSPTA